MLSLYCHVEEPSMAETLRILLPGLVGQRAHCEVINHGSKDQLLKNLPSRLQGYRTLSRSMDLRILVLVDRDDDSCQEVKQKLENMAMDKGVSTKSRPQSDGTFMVVNRIVVEELESWFFGDISAVCAAYDRMSPSLGSKRNYRDPDAIVGGTWEALHREMQKAGYYHDHFPKMEVARKISPHMVCDTNRSPSFQAFCRGVESLLP